MANEESTPTVETAEAVATPVETPVEEAPEEQALPAGEEITEPPEGEPLPEAKADTEEEPEGQEEPSALEEWIGNLSADLEKLSPEERQAAVAEFVGSLDDEDRAALPGVKELEERTRKADEEKQRQTQQAQAQQLVEQVAKDAGDAVDVIGKHLDELVTKANDPQRVDDVDYDMTLIKKGLNDYSKALAKVFSAEQIAEAGRGADARVLAAADAVVSTIEKFGGPLTDEDNVRLKAAAGAEEAPINAYLRELTERVETRVREQLQGEFKRKLKAEVAAERVKIQKDLNLEPAKAEGQPARRRLPDDIDNALLDPETPIDQIPDLLSERQRRRQGATATG